MEIFSNIATQTKHNVDYMPYIISVLHADELQKLGILNLREALSLVPGIDLSIGMAAVKNPVFRGSNPYAMGQSKLIIDGVVVNDKMFGAYGQLLNMPIDIIQRIEIVRGAGSLVNSVNAYSGSIHVITKANKDDGSDKEDSIFGAYGSNSYYMGGFVASYNKDDFELSSDFYYQEDDKSLFAGTDRFGITSDAALWLEAYSLGLNMRYKDFKFQGRISKNDNGIGYGQSFSLSDDSSDHLRINNDFARLSYDFDISKGITAELSAGYFDENRNLQNKVMPDGSSMMMPMGMTTLPKGMYFLVDYIEQTYNQQLEFKLNSFDKHNITAGVNFTQSYIKKDQAQKSTDNLKTLKTMELLSNEKRLQVSYYIDDLINIDEKNSVQIGLKYDSFNDIENQFSPRFAIVHRYNNENIFKLMLTHSYREASWREQYLDQASYFSATPTLISEEVESYEFAYIRKLDIKDSIKFNAFYLHNHNQINSQNPTRTFENKGTNTLRGFEVEFNTQLRDSDKFYINYSYVEADNINKSLGNSANHISKAYYIYTLNKALSLSSIVKYIGSKNSSPDNHRVKTDAYMTADFTLNYKHIASDTLATLSIKNIADTHYYLPAPKDTYEDNFLQEGRSFLLHISKRF